VLHRVLYSSTDRMTCCASGESNAYASEGQMYYVADQPGSDRVALNRYVNAGPTDHADGLSPPANYTLEEVLGYPWTQPSLPGLAPLSEGFDSSTGDYALMRPSESFPGYSASSLSVYGYPRFADSSEVLLSLAAGGVVSPRRSKRKSKLACAHARSRTLAELVALATSHAPFKRQDSLLSEFTTCLIRLELVTLPKKLYFEVNREEVVTSAL